MKRLVYVTAVAASLGLTGLAYAQQPGGAATRATPNTSPTTQPAAGLPGTPSGHEPIHPSAAPSGFTTEAAAKAGCGSDTVVWANPRSKVLHMSGSRSYGKTSRGSYMCEMQATKAGYHTAKPGQ